MRYFNMIRITVFSFLLLFNSILTAQVNPDTSEFEIEKLKQSVDSIQKGSTDSVRIRHAEMFDNLLFEMLKKKGSMEYHFDSLKNLSVLTSKNKLLRVYSFVCPLKNGMLYRYFGFVQFRNKKDENHNVVKLTDAMPDKQVAEKLMLNPQNWMGALYYKLISTSVKGKTYYTLLGWRGNDQETTIKIIDILTIEKEKISFGAPLFQTDFGMRQRILFEYNARAVMSLNYDEKKKRIVFDHLSPPSPQLAGNYKSYGPDFTYDAYQWKQGKWVLIKNVELRNPRSSDPSSPSKKIKQKEFYKPERE